LEKDLPGWDRRSRLADWSKQDIQYFEGSHSDLPASYNGIPLNERYQHPSLYPNTPPALSLGMVQDNVLMPSLGILQDEESPLGILQDDSAGLSDGILLDSPHEELASESVLDNSILENQMSKTLI
jgi:hypothetical protein